MDDLSLHVLALTERWHEGNECLTIKKMRSLGFNVFDEARGATCDQNSICWTNHGEVALVNNTELTKISHWFKLNKLSLNIKKTNYIIFRNKKSLTKDTNLVGITSYSLHLWCRFDIQVYSWQANLSIISLYK